MPIGLKTQKGGEFVSGPFSAGPDRQTAILGFKDTCLARSFRIRSQKLAKPEADNDNCNFCNFCN